MCAQYMNSILAEVSLEALEEANVDLIIIGNGSDKMLNGYRNKAFKCPFKMYADPTLSLYRALGLTRQSWDAGADEDKGDYVVQTAMESTMQTLKRVPKMPLRNPGHLSQLGGEFIFDGTLNVIYTHRMVTSRSHAPIRDICEQAGVRLQFIHYEPGPSPPPVHRYSYIIEEDEEQENNVETWQEQRDAQVERIAALKMMRREGMILRGLEQRRSSELERLQAKQGDRWSTGLGESVRIVGGESGDEDVARRFSRLGLA